MSWTIQFSESIMNGKKRIYQYHPMSFSNETDGGFLHNGVSRNFKYHATETVCLLIESVIIFIYQDPQVFHFRYSQNTCIHNQFTIVSGVDREGVFTLYPFPFVFRFNMPSCIIYDSNSKKRFSSKYSLSIT